MQAFGLYETDDRGRSCYRPPIPAFPRMDDVWGQYERARKAVEEFDRALSTFPVPDVTGKLFARLDAVHSSGAEGTTTTFTDLLEYQTSLSRARDPEDARAVAATADAFDALAESPSLSFTEMALAIHHRLFRNAADSMAAAGAGRLKAYPNGTYDRESPAGTFHYTAPASTADAMAEWESFTAARDDRPELVRQALSHWMFEHIHPVPDGNGRVGRLLVPLALRRKSTLHHACAFLGEAVHLNKDIYVEALKDGRRKGDLGAWTRVFCSLIAQTAAANLDRLHQLEQVYQHWRSVTKSARAHSIVHALVPWVLVTPTFTLRDARVAIGKDLSFQAMNTAVRRLESTGILKQVETSTKERLFIAPDVIRLFEPVAPTLPPS
ncbi:Fic family protein [Telmatospirillum sp. J64-1]|uniref:Fic family protein n=1 Tax=Telmatospirillum sp. J64-1 TaxID=2502183 RepID=UPI00163DDD00|nr:Fic family protein [Telmatospirillum sp. J64-1]